MVLTTVGTRCWTKWAFGLIQPDTSYVLSEWERAGSTPIYPTFSLGHVGFSIQTTQMLRSVEEAFLVVSLNSGTQRVAAQETSIT